MTRKLRIASQEAYLNTQITQNTEQTQQQRIVVQEPRKKLFENRQLKTNLAESSNGKNYLELIIPCPR